MIPKIGFQVLSSLIVVTLSGSAAKAYDLKANVDAVMSPQLSTFDTVGAVVGVIQNGTPSLFTYGVSDLNHPLPVSGDTEFEIGSISKTFTGTLLAILVNRGSVSLTDPISKFLPELTNASLQGITLLQLATHTSGLPRLPCNLNWTDAQNPYANYTESDLIAGINQFQMPPAQRGGTKISNCFGGVSNPGTINYSNWGVSLLGYVLGRASSSTYPELLKNLITTPLQMNDTVIDLSADQKARLAQGYDVSLNEQKPWDRKILFGEGAIRSTGNDFLKFLQIELKPDQTEIGRAVVLTHRIAANDGVSTIGLNWFIETLGSLPLFWHDGMTGGYASLLRGFSASDTGYFYLSNTALELNCLNHAVLGESCSVPARYFHTDAQLMEFAGKYQSPNFTLTVTRVRTALVLQAANQDPIKMEPVAENEFISSDGGITLSFHADPSNHVQGFDLLQNGFLTQAVRSP